MSETEGIREKILDPTVENTAVVGEEEDPKEITLRVVVLSVILAIVLGSANVYLGLFAGV